jgi:hypothetical protein
MHTEGPRPDPLTDLGYEPNDVNLKSIGKATIGFFLFFFLSIAFAYFSLQWGLGPNIYNGGGGGQPRTSINKIPPPGNPLLQSNVTTKTDMQALRQAEERALQSTGWADDAKTRVRIPIDRAIQIVATRGLPPTGVSVPAVTRGNNTDERPVPTAGGQAPGQPTDVTPAPANPPGNGR